MDFLDLLDLARHRAKLDTDAALTRRLGRSHNFISGLRKGYGLPSDEVTAALCELAGVDPLPWLLALNIERTRGPAQTTYSGLAQHLGVSLPKYRRAMVNAAE